MDGPSSSVSPGAANGGGDARRCRRAAAVAHVEEAEKQLRSSESLCLRTVVCALLGPRPRVLREQAAHQRPIMCERTRPFHWQTQACVCSGSAEDVSSLCRAKRLQVFIFQLDKDCDLSWREKGQTVSQHKLCPAGQSRPSVVVCWETLCSLSFIRYIHTRLCSVKRFPNTNSDQ